MHVCMLYKKNWRKRCQEFEKERGVEYKVGDEASKVKQIMIQVYYNFRSKNIMKSVIDI